MAIRIAKHALNEKILTEIEADVDCNQYSFIECAEKMIWGDTIKYHLICNHCGTQFELRDEKYHCSGGYWSPENEKPSATFNEIKHPVKSRCPAM